MHVCICIFPRSNSHSNICTLLKSVAHACVDCTQLLIFPKPGCYFKVTYLQPIIQAEVYQRLKNMACQHNKAFISLSFHPFLTKMAQKNLLGSQSWRFFFFVNPQYAAAISHRLPCGQQQKQIFQLTEWVLRGLSSQLWKNKKHHSVDGSWETVCGLTPIQHKHWKK